MTPHPQGNGKPGDVAESEPVAWMTMAPQTAPLVSAAFLRERPEFRNIYTIPLYTTPQPVIPPGFKVVPETLTEAMHAAAVRTVVRCSGNDDFPPRVWRAMLSAAPVPEAGQGVSDERVVTAAMQFKLIDAAKALQHAAERADQGLAGIYKARAAEVFSIVSEIAPLSPAPAQAQAPVEVSMEQALAEARENVRRWKARVIVIEQAMAGFPASPPPQSAQLIEPKPISDEQLAARFTKIHRGPNPYYACNECGESVPGLRDLLVVHASTHGVPASGSGLMKGKDAVRLPAWQDVLGDAEQLVHQKPIYAKHIKGTVLDNDVPVWIAEFALRLLQRDRAAALSQGQQTEQGSRNG